MQFEATAAADVITLSNVDEGVAVQLEKTLTAKLNAVDLTI